MKPPEIIQTLQHVQGYLENASISKDAVRSMEMGVVKICMMLYGQFADALDTIYKKITFYNTIDSKLWSSLSGFRGLLLLIALGFFAFYIFQNMGEEKSQALANLFYIAIILLAISNISTSAVDFIKVNQTASDVTSKKDAAMNQFRDTTDDVYLLGKNNWNITNYKKEKDKLGKKYLPNIDYLDINEKIEDPKEVNKDEILKYRVVDGKDPGKDAYQLQDIVDTKGLLGSLKRIVTDSYYRWHWHPLQLIIFYVLGMAALAVMGIRAGVLIIRIAFDFEYMKVAGLAHFGNWSKFKSIFTTFLTSYALLAITLWQYRVFQIWESSVTDAPLIPKFLMLLAGIQFLLEGPVVLQKALGVDAGLKSSLGTLAGGLFAGKMAANKGKNIADGAVSTTADGLGLAKGLKSGKGTPLKDKSQVVQSSALAEKLDGKKSDKPGKQDEQANQGLKTDMDKGKQGNQKDRDQDAKDRSQSGNGTSNSGQIKDEQKANTGSGLADQNDDLQSSDVQTNLDDDTPKAAEEGSGLKETNEKPERQSTGTPLKVDSDSGQTAETINDADMGTSGTLDSPQADNAETGEPLEEAQATDETQAIPQNPITAKISSKFVSSNTMAGKAIRHYQSGKKLGQEMKAYQDQKRGIQLKDKERPKAKGKD